ncbi:MAG: ATP-binding protein, partial [Candidatus Bathyarchaeia archaeon]
MRLGPLLAERFDLAYDMRLKGLEPVTLHLIGPAGIGKSAFTRAWAERKAKQLGLQFVDADTIPPEEVEKYLESPDKYFIYKDCRLTSLDPVDVSGLPRAVDSKYVMFLPLGVARLLNACAGLLFLDEFLNESRPNMLSASYKIVRDYKIGDIALNPGAMVVAASNTAQYSSIASSIPKPLRDRFDFVEVEPPELKDWADWMDETYGRGKWDREILAYLYWKPSDFLANVSDTVEDDGYEPPATPRGWSYVALAFAEAKARGWNGELLHSIAKGKLGRVGESLMAFLSNKVPSFEELVATPQLISGFKVEQKFLAAMTVAEAINRDTRNIARAKRFIEYVAEADDREFLSAFFAFLEKPKRRAVFNAVKDNQTIV